jgi:hypothetical protein
MPAAEAARNAGEHDVAHVILISGTLVPCQPAQIWRGEHYAATRAEYQAIKNQLAAEVFPAAPAKGPPGGSRFGGGGGGGQAAGGVKLRETTGVQDQAACVPCAGFMLC